MPGNEPDDLEAVLTALRVHDASADRVDRTRARAVAALGVSRRRSRAPAARFFARRAAWLEPVAALGVSAIYLATAAQLSLVFLRVLHR